MKRYCPGNGFLVASATVTLFSGHATPLMAQTLGHGTDDGISYWRVLAALVLCLGLAVAGAFAIRSRMGGSLKGFRLARHAHRLQLVETLRLSHQADVSIVICDGREFLVGVSPGGVALLEELPSEAEHKEEGGVPEQ